VASISPPRGRRSKLGHLLLEKGIISDAQLEHAQLEQSKTKKTLGRILMEAGYVTEGQLTELLARAAGHDFLDLSNYAIEPAAAAALPEAIAKRYRAVPIGFEDGRLVVALSDPTNVIAIDDIRTITGRDIKIVIAARTDIEEALGRIQALDASAQTVLQEIGPAEEVEEERAEAEDAPIVKAINLLISQAVKQRASDIHVEPQESNVRIRYRIDGVLHEKGKAPKSQQAGMVSRLKVMAELNIAEKRVPQDGRISLKVDGSPIDLRVATLPSVWGEKVVMRILDSKAALIDLDKLGFLPETLKRYEESYTKPYGAILVTGPTGSGKSTTLYSTLKIINSAEKNIITVEDPVEYRLPGITQVQMNPKAGLTFAVALRSILRADPDILMVGEMRDKETATIGVEAALTGHLVLSTLHTNDAPSAITRLIEMGVEPFLVASALDCILAQRLARRLCEKCKEPYEPTPEALEEAHVPFWRPGEELPTLSRPGGRSCQHCASTGYRGRLSLVEVMPVTEEIERLTAEHRSSEDLKRVAIEQGMAPLRDDGMEKVRLGVTSIEEVLRVVV
jgi:type IV pilus assembly protein PilB